MENCFNIDLNKLSLNDNYKSYGIIKDRINDHISNVIYLASTYDNKVKDLFSNEFSFSNYEFSCDLIKENTNGYSSYIDQYDDRINLFEEQLYKKLKADLGSYFDYNDKFLMKLLDNTIDKYVEDLIFKNLDKNDLSSASDSSSSVSNPFLSAGEILSSERMLFDFDDYSIEYSDFSKKKKNESSIIEGKKISVLTKCNNKKYNYTEIRDTFFFRNLIIEELTSRNRDCSNPIERKEIFSYFRNLGVSQEQLSDSNIYNWIIKPLKKYSKLGSNRKGYFVILNHEDLLESYRSHLNTYRGFYKTLENHRLMYKNIIDQNDLDIPEDFFKSHLK